MRLRTGSFLSKGILEYESLHCRLLCALSRSHQNVRIVLSSELPVQRSGIQWPDWKARGVVLRLCTLGRVRGSSASLLNGQECDGFLC